MARELLAPDPGRTNGRDVQGIGRNPPLDDLPRRALSSRRPVDDAERGRPCRGPPATGSRSRRSRSRAAAISAAEGVTVVAIGGAQAIERTLQGLSGVRVAGLYDVAEERDVLRGLERAGRGADGFFACDPDLEGELVRALGTERMLELVEARGQLGAFTTYRKQPAQRDQATGGAATRLAAQLEDPLRRPARRGARPRPRAAAARTGPL